MRTHRIGEVWEHDVSPRGQLGSLLLVLRDDPRRGLASEPGVERWLPGWRCLNLESARLDWMPDTCFDSPWWRRVA